MKIMKLELFRSTGWLNLVVVVTTLSSSACRNDRKSNFPSSDLKEEVVVDEELLENYFQFEPSTEKSKLFYAVQQFLADSGIELHYDDLHLGMVVVKVRADQLEDARVRIENVPEIKIKFDKLIGDGGL